VPESSRNAPSFTCTSHGGSTLTDHACVTSPPLLALMNFSSGFPPIAPLAIAWSRQKVRRVSGHRLVGAASNTPAVDIEVDQVPETAREPDARAPSQVFFGTP